MRRAPLLLLLSLAGCSGGAPTPPGKAYFAQAGCASCHRVGAEGSAVGPDLTLVGFRHSREWMEKYVADPQAWNPKTLMPNRRLPPDAVKEIVGWLAEQKGQAWAPGGKPWEGASQAGRVVFTRAGCAACHGLEGAGGYPNNNVKGGQIPALQEMSEKYTKAELVAKIRNGVVPEPESPSAPAPMIRMPAWKDVLSESEIDAVASYLLALPKGPNSSTDW